jgi:hypothetical protein
MGFAGVALLDLLKERVFPEASSLATVALVTLSALLSGSITIRTDAVAHDLDCLYCVVFDDVLQLHLDGGPDVDPIEADLLSINDFFVPIPPVSWLGFAGCGLPPCPLLEILVKLLVRKVKVLFKPSLPPLFLPCFLLVFIVFSHELPLVACH